MSSDWYCQLDELIPQFKKLIEKAKPREDILMGVGDIFDFLSWGKVKFKDSKAINCFIELLGESDIYCVTEKRGHHPWVRKPLRTTSIKVYRLF